MASLSFNFLLISKSDENWVLCVFKFDEQNSTFKQQKEIIGFQLKGNVIQEFLKQILEKKQLIQKKMNLNMV